MCAINGFASKSTTLVSSYPLTKLRDLQKHRGPDDFGEWASDDGMVVLGHRRLSIVDLSSAGHQPMVSSDGLYSIVFNGEIYNFRNIRDELIEEGFTFNSDSDTEVLLAAYKLWGVDCVAKFNGMFAFVIYYSGSNESPPLLFFARDRAGKKPFYYFYDGKIFEFSSELKSISSSKKISLKAVNNYLSLGYIPGDLCFLEGVMKLPPASMGILNLDTFNLKIWKYWQLPSNTASSDIDGDDLANHAEALLADAISLRMISDVPLGVMLSGGMDSSIIAAIAAKLSSFPIKTFTLSLPGSELDESSYARCVADHLGTDHYVLELPHPSLSDLEIIAPLIDEPIADSSLIPSFLISRLTKNHVKVALGGDGGDELFGGYSDYLAALNSQKYLKYIPKCIINILSDLAGYFPAGIKGRSKIVSFKNGGLQQLIWGSPYFDIGLRKKILTDDSIKLLSNSFNDPEMSLLSLYDSGVDPVDSMTRTHFCSILPDDFLVKVDRASMANGLEMRTPFLDYRLVEFAFSSIPSKWKVFANETRRIEKILAKRLLPSNLNVGRKQGFSIPLDNWMRADKCQLLKKYIPYLPDCINRDEINRLIKGLFLGRANGARLYALLVLGIAMKNLNS